MSDPLNIGVVGFGYWGPHLVRALTANRDTHVVTVADVDQERRAAARDAYPAIEVVGDADRLLERSDIDAVALAGPLATHFPMTRAALRAGKHVLVEAPLAVTVSQCGELEALARQSGRTLMVDSTILYTPAVQKIREMISDGRLGRVLSFDSSRVNLGLTKPDRNVLWDLATYDLSVLGHVIGLEPSWVSAIGARHHDQRENLAYVIIGFPNQLIAHLHVNWVAPVKTRRIVITGTERMLVLDDTVPADRLRVFESGVISAHLERDAAHGMNTGYRTGDVFSPKLGNHDALRLLIADFARACRTGSSPTTGIESGTRVVRLLEAAQRSLEKNGKRVVL